VHELARDAMRHRLVMSYRALAEGVSADAVIGPVLDTVPMPRVELVSEVA
jgi:MoxR-like ATPase